MNRKLLWCRTSLLYIHLCNAFRADMIHSKWSNAQFIKLNSRCLWPSLKAAGGLRSQSGFARALKTHIILSERVIVSLYSGTSGMTRPFKRVLTHWHSPRCVRYGRINRLHIIEAVTHTRTHNPKPQYCVTLHLYSNSTSSTSQSTIYEVHAPNIITQCDSLRSSSSDWPP